MVDEEHVPTEEQEQKGREAQETHRGQLKERVTQAKDELNEQTLPGVSTRDIKSGLVGAGIAAGGILVGELGGRVIAKTVASRLGTMVPAGTEAREASVRSVSSGVVEAREASVSLSSVSSDVTLDMAEFRRHMDIDPSYADRFVHMDPDSFVPYTNRLGWMEDTGSINTTTADAGVSPVRLEMNIPAGNAEDAAVAGDLAGLKGDGALGSSATDLESTIEEVAVALDEDFV